VSGDSKASDAVRSCNYSSVYANVFLERGFYRFHACIHAYTYVCFMYMRHYGPFLCSQVTLCTIHAAKGLEWTSVFLVGVQNNLIPHSAALKADEEVCRWLFFFM